MFTKKVYGLSLIFIISTFTAFGFFPMQKCPRDAIPCELSGGNCCLNGCYNCIHNSTGECTSYILVTGLSAHPVPTLFLLGYASWMILHMIG